MQRFDYDPLLAELREAVKDLKAAGGVDNPRCTSDLLAIGALAQALRDHSDGLVDQADLLFSIFSKAAALIALRASRENSVVLMTQLMRMMAVLEAQNSLFPPHDDLLPAGPPAVVGVH